MMARIVCIDDQQDILDIVKLSLEILGGHEVSTFRYGRDAVDAMAELKPDAILLDNIMNGWSGRETLLALRQDPALRSIPVIIMTARTRPTELQEFMTLGAQGTLVKPFGPDELVAAINSVVSAPTQ